MFSRLFFYPKSDTFQNLYAACFCLGLFACLFSVNSTYIKEKILIKYWRRIPEHVVLQKEGDQVLAIPTF